MTNRPRMVGLGRAIIVMDPLASGAFHGALIYLAATQTMGAGSVPFDAVDDDTDGYFTAGHAVIPTGLGGRYALHGQLWYTAQAFRGGTAAIQEAVWQANIFAGGKYAAVNRINDLSPPIPVGADDTFSIGAVLNLSTTDIILADGDEVDLAAYTSVGGVAHNVQVVGSDDLGADGFTTFLALHRIGNAPA